MATRFFTKSGGASTAKAGTMVIPPGGTKRWVQLVLDDTNWILERSLDRAQGDKAKIPFAGACPFWLDPGQGLWIQARLATGGAGTQWNLSVTVCDDAA